ncbi:MAG: transporter [Salinibacter sp.]|uniref:transporter n=1 Tax=Salinibacter sp. TaxID=2065818 RepID=UPI0035D40D62
MGQISADRPGFGNGTATVAPGTFQVELGAAAANDDFGTDAELGQLLLRYGVAGFLELRGGVGSLALDAPDTEYTGTSVGGKLRLFRSSLSALSVVSTWALPTGSGAFEADRVSQTLALAYNGALREGLSLSINVGASVPYGGDAAPSYLFIPTLSVGLTDQVGGYVGYAGFYSTGLNANYVEAGLTLTSSPDTQLDVNTGLQVDENRSAFFAGLGLAHRF